GVPAPGGVDRFANLAGAGDSGVSVRSRGSEAGTGAAREHPPWWVRGVARGDPHRSEPPARFWRRRAASDRRRGGGGGAEIFDRDEYQPRVAGYRAGAADSTEDSNFVGRAAVRQGAGTASRIAETGAGQHESHRFRADIGEHGVSRGSPGG